MNSTELDRGQLEKSEYPVDPAKDGAVIVNVVGLEKTYSVSAEFLQCIFALIM